MIELSPRSIEGIRYTLFLIQVVIKDFYSLLLLSSFFNVIIVFTNKKFSFVLPLLKDKILNPRSKVNSLVTYFIIMIY